MYGGRSVQILLLALVAHKRNGKNRENSHGMCTVSGRGVCTPGQGEIGAGRPTHTLAERERLGVTRHSRGVYNGYFGTENWIFCMLFISWEFDVKEQNKKKPFFLKTKIEAFDSSFLIENFMRRFSIKKIALRAIIIPYKQSEYIFV